jgi:hypothetical protein
MLQQHLGQAEALLRSGPFAVGVRELLGHYMSLEELYLEDTTDMAIRIDEVVSWVAAYLSVIVSTLSSVSC